MCFLRNYFDYCNFDRNVNYISLGQHNIVVSPNLLFEELVDLPGGGYRWQRASVKLFCEVVQGNVI